eukprot:862464-Ditylum_brightwellii.AAC.1
MVATSGVDCLAPNNLYYRFTELVESGMCQITFPGYRPEELKLILPQMVKSLKKYHLEPPPTPW